MQEMERTIATNKMQFHNELEKRVEQERVKFEKREENIKHEFKQQSSMGIK